MIVQTAREMGDRSLSPFKMETDNLDLLHLTSQGVDYPNIVYKPRTDRYLPYVLPIILQQMWIIENIA